MSKEKNIIAAIFGEAEKGRFSTPYFFNSLPPLLEKIGNPPPFSQGLYFAIQTILLNHAAFFFRVKEEGFAPFDYQKGFKFLQEEKVDAICIPGVGDDEIIKTAKKICDIQKSVLIITEKDLYDYLTN